MKGILDKYDKVDSGWIVRYKTVNDNLIVYKHVMLHPNQVNYAEIDKEVEFRIESCPNLQNGGDGGWKDMAIIETGETTRIGEIMEKFKDKIMFPKMVERAKESLKGVKIPEPNGKTYGEDELSKILLDFMLFDTISHEETRGSKIKRFLEELKQKNQ